MPATPLHGLQTVSGKAIICIKNFLFQPGRGKKENPQVQCLFANIEARWSFKCGAQWMKQSNSE